MQLDINIMLNDDELTQWSLNYKQVLNNPAVRRRLDGHDSPHGFVSFKKTGTQTVKWIQDRYAERGTIEFLFGDGTAHYLSYYPDGDPGKIVVFDPSFTSNPGQVAGGFPLDPWMELRLDTTWSFPNGVRRWRMYEQHIPLQIYRPRIGQSDDTWCQSWSLAMLHPSLQGLVQGYLRQPNADYMTRRFQAENVVAFFADLITEDDYRLALDTDAYADAWNLHRTVLYGRYHLSDLFYRFYTKARTVVTPYAPRYIAERQRPRPRNLLRSFNAD